MVDWCVSRGVPVWKYGELVSAEVCRCGSVVNWCVSQGVLVWKYGELMCQLRCAMVEVWWTGVSAEVY